MKILVMSDLHLSARPRDRYRFDALESFQKIAKKEQPDAILLCGDLTEEKDRHPALLVNQVVKHMSALSKIAPLAILKANHDYKDEAHPFFAFLSHLPNVHWIGEISEAAELPPLFRKPFAGCLFLPHTHNPKRDWSGWVDRTTFRFIFAHQLFSGAASENGKRLSGVDPSLIPNNQYVLSGDVHSPHKVTDHIEYIGAPYHVDFGDDYDSRFVVLNGENSRKVTSYRTDEWPQKRLVVFDGGSGASTGTDDVNAGDIVLARVQVKSMENWLKVRASIDEWAASCRVILHRVEPIIAGKSVRRNVKIKGGNREDDAEVIKQFCKRHGVDERTEQAGLEIVEATK